MFHLTTMRGTRQARYEAATAETHAYEMSSHCDKIQLGFRNWIIPFCELVAYGLDTRGFAAVQDGYLD